MTPKTELEGWWKFWIHPKELDLHGKAYGELEKLIDKERKQAEQRGENRMLGLIIDEINTSILCMDLEPNNLVKTLKKLAPHPVSRVQANIREEERAEMMDDVLKIIEEESKKDRRFQFTVVNVQNLVERIQKLK